MFEKIMEKYGEEYMLRQLAEECAELAQAALKVIRAQKKETPMRIDEAMEHLMEEIADVEVMMDGVCTGVLNAQQRWAIVEIEGRKKARMRERMLDGKMEEDVW